MYRLFIKDAGDAQTGIFREYSSRYSKTAGCHIPHHRDVGEVRRDGDRVVFVDYIQRKKKTFSAGEERKAVDFGRVWFDTYKHQVAKLEK